MTNLLARIDKFNLELAPKKPANPYSVRQSAKAVCQKSHKLLNCAMKEFTSELVLRHPRQLPVGVPAVVEVMVGVVQEEVVVVMMFQGVMQVFVVVTTAVVMMVMVTVHVGPTCWTSPASLVCLVSSWHPGRLEHQ